MLPVDLPKGYFREAEGFTGRTIFNEDMIYAAGAIQAGYGVAYVPEARVIHSHNLSPMQQFRRNFDMAVSQAEHPEIFAEIRSESEGIRLVKQTACGCAAGSGPSVLAGTSGCKYPLPSGKTYEKNYPEKWFSGVP